MAVNGEILFALNIKKDICMKKSNGFSQMQTFYKNIPFWKEEKLSILMLRL